MSNFPIEFFPDDLIPIIEEVAYCNRFDIDYLCSSILSVAATAIGGSYSIQVKDSWIEKPVLWIAIVGLPGVSKSHPIAWAMDPINRREKDIYRKYREALKEFSQDPDNDNKPKPDLVKTVIGDATPEAIAHQLSINPRGVLIHNDELSGFLSTFQRYNKGNDEQFYLTVWSGKPWVVDRKTSFPIRLNEPVVNINGTIQPGVLSKLFSDKEDSGFADRWLICNPKGIKKEYWTDDVVSYDSINTYNAIISDLMDLNMTTDDWGNITSNLLSYEPEAFNTIREWHVTNTDEINKTDNEQIRSIRAKMEIYVHRFALIAYLLDCVSKHQGPYKVCQRAAKHACELSEYFIRNIISTRYSNPSDNLSGNWKELYDMLPIDEQEFHVSHYMNLAISMGIPEGTAKSFLSRNTDKLFGKHKRGFYYKKLVAES